MPGDGRELVATVAEAVKVRAEDGRRVAAVDISPFINNLPLGRPTHNFTSDDASGSTSQAAAIQVTPPSALQSHTCRLLLQLIPPPRSAVLALTWTGYLGTAVAYGSAVRHCIYYSLCEPRGGDLKCYFQFLQEAVEVGARCLLLDEDTCATNFMIRDARMQVPASAPCKSTS